MDTLSKYLAGTLTFVEESSQPETDVLVVSRLIRQQKLPRDRSMKHSNENHEPFMAKHGTWNLELYYKHQ